ncbi:TetR/AcrR family transcriptional regulator [Spongiimicrobium salis]|uniref:TetR/AcrR family transcriptional regulator n=1 Tax=Spongiimicrobium salis TaxID=1667022 RepID=UPI00374CA5BF
MSKQGVKDRIVIAASILFYHKGYNQTGINSIIEEANVSKDSLYRYFRSKEAIAVAYLEARHLTWMGNLEAFVTVYDTNTQKVMGVFDYLNKWLTEVAFRGCGFQNIIGDLPKDHKGITDQVAEHKNALRTWVYTLLKNDKRADAGAMADEIMVLIEGAIILSQIQKDPWPIQVAKNNCVRLLS